jgi:pimeloyl-ACP methyl ester carboxylesterase
VGQLYILLALALILFFGQFTEAKLCARIFTAPTLSSVKIENSLHHKLETSPNPKGNILLIHGLGDSLVQLNQLAKKFRSEGYTVLRVDLHGHGKNLERDVLEKRQKERARYLITCTHIKV